jgi:exonuclease III
MFVSASLSGKLEDTKTKADILDTFIGSDHAPVTLEVAL